MKSSIFNYPIIITRKADAIFFLLAFLLRVFLGRVFELAPKAGSRHACNRDYTVLPYVSKNEEILNRQKSAQVDNWFFSVLLYVDMAKYEVFISAKRSIASCMLVISYKNFLGYARETIK